MKPSLLILMLSLNLACAASVDWVGQAVDLNRSWAEAAFGGPAAASGNQLLLREEEAGNTRINLAAVGTPLRLGEKTYARGIGSNALCELRVRLAQPAARFVADIGLDRNVDASTPASVEFHVLVGGKEVFSSGVMRPGDGVRSIDVPLDGAREFELVLDNGGDSRIYDQGDWADARVILQDGSELWLDDLAKSGSVVPGLPFSFVYGGKPSAELLPNWKRTIRDESPDATRTVRTLTFTDPETGLEVKAVATIYRDTPGVDWTLHFTNGGKQATHLLENVRAVDVGLVPAIGKIPTLHRLHGSAALTQAWMPFDQAVPSAPGGRIEFGAFQGKPARTNSPFFTLDWGTGGVITAVGWSGQWIGSVERAASGEVRLQAGMQFLSLSLQPGESIRSPRILQVYWDGGDRDQAHNLFRRTMLAHIVPQRDGKPILPPIAHTTSSLRENNATNEAIELGYLESIKDLGFEYHWLDAWWTRDGFPNGMGHYGFPLERAEAPDRFPRGMKAFGRTVHDAGLRFLMWFEPERVSPGTAIAREHPDWVITAPGDHGFNSGLFDLGLPEAREFMTGYLKSAIREYGLDCLRIDFNIDPLPFWQARNSEQPGRVGMTEIRYVEGLYKMWDEIRAEFPQVAIDNCASGGTRIDLETCSRAIALWRTDDTSIAIVQHDFDQAALQNQVMTGGLNRYVPFSVCGTIGAAPYHFRSGFDAGITFCDDTRPADYPRELLKQGIAEGKRLRKYYTGDFYPLSEVTTDPRDWTAMQYHLPNSDEGLVLGFRRHKSPFTAFQCALNGIDPAATYEVTRSSGYKPEAPLKMKGGDLQRLNLEIPEMPGSVVLEYKKVAGQPSK